MKVSDPAFRKNMTMKEFAELNGVRYKTFHFRIRKGYSVMDAITLTEGEIRRARAETHGMSNTPTYSSWESMHSRCRGHSHYVQRDIKVCEAWTSFDAFLRDMGQRPSGTTLDRIDGSLGYFPGNCRWATHKEQARNTARNRKITAFGETKTMTEWAIEFGLLLNTLRNRIDGGYEPELALTLPVSVRNKKRGKRARRHS